MTAQPIKTILLDLLQQGHRDEEAFLQELSETERTAIGTPTLWSAKDNVAHMTFWHQEFIQQIITIQQHQQLTESEVSTGHLNSMNFEKHQFRSWSDIHVESQRVHTQFITLIEQLSEEDLTAPNYFGWPLYAAILGRLYEHDQEHLTQYYIDHHDLPRAIKIRENCANRVIQADVPAWVKGSFLYNLACFYAQLPQLEKAAAFLQEALIHDPNLEEQSKNDPELAALREHSATDKQR